MVHRVGNHSDHLAIHLQEVLEGGAVAGVAGVGELHALRLARRACARGNRGETEGHLVAFTGGNRGENVCQKVAKDWRKSAEVLSYRR